MADDFNFDLDEVSNLLSEIFESEGGGKPIDVWHDETTKEIERTRKRLAAEYKQAQKELERSANQYFKKFEKEDKRRARLVAQGKIKESDYKNWRKNRILYHKGMQAQVDSMAEYLANVGQQAADIVNGRLPRVYAGNYNYARYEVEKGLKIDTAFTLFDEHSVNRLAHKNPRLLPKVHPDKIKGEKWSKRKINNVISQGILQGKPLTEVAHGLEDVCRMEWSSAYRNARTAMTGAQNGGRFDSYKEAEQMGINLQKQWLATLDGHTRKSHRALDGESVPIKETFSNDLMYPADPDGHPAEVYNCRCTMIADLADYQDESFMRWDNIDGVPIEYCTYTEWEAARKVKTGATKPQTFDQKIRAIKANKTLSELEKIEQAGQAFSDEINSGYLVEMQKESDELRKAHEAAKASRGSKTIKEYWSSEEYNAWQTKRYEFEQKYGVDGASAKLADMLGKVRPVGYKDEKALRNHLSIRRISDSGKSVMHAYNHYPTEWVQKSLNTGYLKVKKVERGYYNHWEKEIAISGDDLNDMKETAFHELGHRFEQAVPEIKKQEKLFYERRTAGESLEWLGEPYDKSEKTRRDKFLDAYMGKDYGGWAYELVSMGFEYAYTAPQRLAQDPEMQRWIYGMLCVL